MVVLSNYSPRFTSFWQAETTCLHSSEKIWSSPLASSVLMFTPAMYFPAPFAARPARLSAHLYHRWSFTSTADHFSP